MSFPSLTAQCANYSLAKDAYAEVPSDTSGSASGLAQWKATAEEQTKEWEKAGMDRWMKWSKENEDSIVGQGSPLGKTKRMNAEGISDTKNEIGAYTIVQAESQQAAAESFLNHPHFMIFPGESVEVTECLPIPGM